MLSSIRQEKLFLKAEWITRLDNPIEKEFTFFQDRPTIILSKAFELEQLPREAALAICGLGYYRAKINGQRVGDSVLNSDVTNYNKMVYYDTYDVRHFLAEGINQIEVELGNGWYNPAPIQILGRYNLRKQLSIGKPCLICDLQLDDKHIYSDNSWASAYGQILQNDVYIGEVYTDEPQSDKTGKTVTIAGPAGRLTPSFIPKIKRQKGLRPKSIIKNELGWLLDFGQILTGQAVVQIEKNFVGGVTIQYAEEKTDEHCLKFDSSVSGRYGLAIESQNIKADTPVIQQDIIHKIKKETLHYSNQYTYHSFRYVQILAESETNPLEEMIAYPTHTAIPIISEFHSSSPILNDLWQAAIHTRLNNIHSYFEDCSRERLGYGGDTVALLESHLATVDAESLIKKVFLDFANDQRLDGGITQTAPYVGIMTNGTSNGAGSLGWQLVFPTLANTIVHQYAGNAFIQPYFAALRQHLDYLLSFDYNYIKQCCLGDWGSIDETADGPLVTSPDQDFCSACMYILILKENQKLFASMAVEEPLMQELTQTISTYQRVVRKEFYNEAAGCFGKGTASSWIFAIKSGVCRPTDDAYDKMIDLIVKRDGIFPFGIFGMSWAYEILAEKGDNQLILDWLLREDDPSYYGMLQTGNGTLSEHFAGAETFAGSKNHAMFSSYSAWMLRKLLGIKVEGRTFYLQPYMTDAISELKGSLQTKEGLISVERQDRQLRLSFPDYFKLDISHFRKMKQLSFTEQNGQITIDYEVL